MKKINFWYVLGFIAFISLLAGTIWPQSPWPWVIPGIVMAAIFIPFAGMFLVQFALWIYHWIKDGSPFRDAETKEAWEELQKKRTRRNFGP